MGRSVETNSRFANGDRGRVDHQFHPRKIFKKMMLAWNKLGPTAFC